MASREQIERADWNSFSAEQQAAISEAAAKLEHRFGVKIVFSPALDAALTPSEGVGGANIRPVQQRCKAARRARELLQAAHDACFKALDRDILGMSSGPFSGVNEVLGLIAEMDSTLAAQAAQIASLSASRDGYARQSDARAAECDRLSAKLAAVEGERDEARLSAQTVGDQLGQAVDRLTRKLDAAEARATELQRENERLEKALRRIAEGNLGDASWEADYEKIRQVARAALQQEGGSDE